MERVVNEISAVLKEYDCNSMIDVGVGTGRFALPISSKGFEVAGIDISREMLKKARAKNLDNILLADGRMVPFTDNAFDAAMTVHVLHLTSNWQSVLGEIRRITKKILVSSGAQSDGLNMRLKYLELRQEMDHSFTERGLKDGETTLATMLPPDKTLKASDGVETIKMDEEIEYFEKRGSAITLDTPEQTHKAIIDVLKSSYSGKKLQRARREMVYVWRIESLEELV